MNKISLPTSDAERLTFLEQVLIAVQDTSTALLPTATIQNIRERTIVFAEARHSMIEARAKQREATATATKAVRLLNEYIHQIWQTVTIQVRWQQLSPTVLTYYQLQVDGSGPGRNSDANWIDIAKRMVTGAEQAATAGFTVNLVDMASLQGALEQAQTALAAVTVARNNLVQAQQQMHEQRQTISSLIRHTVSDLRYALRDEAPIQRRQRMRAYGIRFRYEEGETAHTVPVDDAA